MVFLLVCFVGGGGRGEGCTGGRYPNPELLLVQKPQHKLKQTVNTNSKQQYTTSTDKLSINVFINI